MRSCHHAREEDEGIVSMEEMSLLQKEKTSLDGEQKIETVGSNIEPKQTK